ncbi:MAG: DUF3095 domain-containing protein [Rhodothermales bacterium]
MSDSFYADLPAHRDFARISDPDAYAPVPADWSVVITDVRGSTAAVAAGRYRAVNYAGAASITALLNVAGDLALPFVFGGDGATLLLPPRLAATVPPILRAVQRVVAADLGLDLRAGIVPVADLYRRGARLTVLKHAVSPNYDQAMFSGGGLLVAEHLVKDLVTAEHYDVGDGPVWDDPERKLYEGLECRWEEISSRRGEVVTLLVLATGETEAERLGVYRDALRVLDATYGDAAHPVSLDALRLARRPAHLDLEASVRAAPSARVAYRRKHWLLNLLGIALVGLRLKTQETDWEQYPKLLRASTDFRKFDDTLRMVLSGSPEQREALAAWLDGQRKRGRLAYGLHVSDRATLTCLVFNRMGRQVHFVDGADGGYTTAARQLKRQIARDRLAEDLRAETRLAEGYAPMEMPAV